MQIKFKKTHPGALMPVKASDGAAGFDMYALSFYHEPITANNTVMINGEETVVGHFDTAYRTVIDTCIAVEIPEGYVGYLFPRGSISKQSAIFSNSVGVIDSDFRGSIKVILQDHHPKSKDEFHRYKIGDRVAQLIIMPIPDIEFVEVGELSETKRGTGMLGSTGSGELI